MTIDAFVPALPLAAGNPSQLFSAITPIIQGITRGLMALGTRERPTWRDTILQLEVPPEYARGEFELSRREMPAGELGRYFRCVVVRPHMLERVPGGMGPDVAHPQFHENSVAVWARMPALDLADAIRDRDCMFAGPSVWFEHDGPVSPAVAAFDTIAGAVLQADVLESDALQKIFGADLHRTWGEILDSVTELRRRGERVLVLWDDPNYDVPLAEAL